MNTMYIYITGNDSTVQLASKFTARIGKNAYLARFFARHEELHGFDARVSKLLAQATTFASHAAHDFYVLTRIPRISRARKFARESFNAKVTYTRTITIQVNLRWRPP